MTMTKIVAVGPNIAQRVIDRTIKLFGAAGVSEDFPLAHFYANARTLRIADSSDEVRSRQNVKLEIKKYQS